MTDRPAEQDDDLVQDGEDPKNEEKQVHVSVSGTPLVACERRSSSPR